MNEEERRKTRFDEIDGRKLFQDFLRLGINLWRAVQQVLTGFAQAAATAIIVLCVVAAGVAWRTFRPAFSPSLLSDGNRASPNREANSYYEKALLFGGGAVEDNGQRIRMLERALALDPKFAAARAESVGPEEGRDCSVSAIRRL